MKTASIYDGGNLTELPKVLVMSNISYSNHLIFLSFLTIGHQCHFTDLSRVCSPDFKQRDWEENRVEYQRISWGRNSCKIALGWQSGYNSHRSLELAIFWGMKAVTYSIITKIRLEGTSWSAQLKAGIMSKPDEIARGCAQSCFEDLWGWRQILFLSFY